MSPPKFEPGALRDVTRPGYVPPPAPHDAPTRVLQEAYGDTALAAGQFERALAAYRVAKGSSWRLRLKMAWCCYMLDHVAECASLLKDAPRREDTLALMLLIRCVGDQNGRTGERDFELDALVRSLMALPELIPECYEFADRHVIDAVERLNHLRIGFERFPEDASVRRRYIRALWGTDSSEELVLALAREAVAGQVPAQEDLWQGIEIAEAYGLYDEALALVRRLSAGSSAAGQRALALVEADLQVHAGRPGDAVGTFRQILEGMDWTDSGEEASMHAARGLLHLLLQEKDQKGIEAAAAMFAAAFCRHGVMSIAEQTSPIGFQSITIQTGSISVSYMPYADLTELRDAALGSIADVDVRALLKVLYAKQEGPMVEVPQDVARALLLSAAAESTVCVIQRDVGWTLMDAGDFEAAGRAFARFEVARVLQGRGAWEAYDDASMFEEAPFDDEAVVDQFAEGMFQELFAAVNDHPEELVDQAYNVTAAYLRTPLLEHRLFSRFRTIMEAVVDNYCSIGHRPPATVWFDCGLARQCAGQGAEAIAGYRACLELAPSHPAARTNLLMLLPPAARISTIIDQEVTAIADIAAPRSIDEMTLEQAVFLLAMYRGCAGAEQDLVLRPFGEAEHPFSPTPEMLQPLFSLLRTGLVRIGRESPAEAFTVQESPPRVQSFDMNRLFWELSPSAMERIREIENACLSGTWPAPWRQQVHGAALAIARHECLAFLRFCADDRKLPMPAGEKTMLMIDNALSTYSVAQAYSFFWQGAAGASDFMRRKGVSSTHAANTIISTCQRRLDSARAHGWDVKPFTRPREVRRSQLAYTLFDTFLGFGERAFTTPLTGLFSEEAGDE